ncbi:uncharacterized protein C8orf88 homolog [Meleagris gallopavo]|uniref:uncharacterized protein C8orf88 homolog n=1 Tax=Meleagris gallopavo TaxID=9103 RepID=UPI00093D6F15|nr:uncharacterized protein C8orf88 homolog [Meleagris gallopavo]
MAHRGSGEVVSGGGRVGAGLWAVRGKGLGCGRCPGVKLPHGEWHFKMLKGAQQFVGKSLQPALPVSHLSSKQASEVAFNFQTELPSNAQVCLQSKVDWVSTE